MSIEKLRESLDQAEWNWIKPHVARDGVILISQSLQILDVGNEVANNNSQKIETWINKGLLTKPTPAQIETWDQEPGVKFLCLVVAPYVLIQQLPSQLQ